MTLFFALKRRQDAVDIEYGIIVVRQNEIDSCVTCLCGELRVMRRDVLDNLQIQFFS